MEGEALAIRWNGKPVPTEKLEPLFSILQADLARRVKRLESIRGNDHDPA
jgi:hypothetical protein